MLKQIGVSGECTGNNVLLFRLKELYVMKTDTFIFLPKLRIYIWQKCVISKYFDRVSLGTNLKFTESNFVYINYFFPAADTSNIWQCES